MIDSCPNDKFHIKLDIANCFNQRVEPLSFFSRSILYEWMDGDIWEAFLCVPQAEIILIDNLNENKTACGQKGKGQFRLRVYLVYPFDFWPVDQWHLDFWRGPLVLDNQTLEFQAVLDLIKRWLF